MADDFPIVLNSIIGIYFAAVLFRQLAVLFRQLAVARRPSSTSSSRQTWKAQAGVITTEQLRPGGVEYTGFREFMTHEALAAVRAAKEAGATRILVADSHGLPRRLGMTVGSMPIPTLSCSSATMPRPTIRRACGRTRSPAVRRPRCSHAAIAGYFGVPVILIAGDQAAVAEVCAAVGPIEAVETRRAPASIPRIR